MAEACPWSVGDDVSHGWHLHSDYLYIRGSHDADGEQCHLDQPLATIRFIANMLSALCVGCVSKGS